MSRRPRRNFAWLVAALSVTVSMLGSTALAQPASQPTHVADAMPSPLERANADAVARLEAQIVAERVDETLTIGQLLDRVEGRARLTEGLRLAEQVGGPRYVSDELVQVQRQIDGRQVASLLKQAVDEKPDRCPVSPDRFDAYLSKWSTRAFASTGTSDRPAPSATATTADVSTVRLPDRAPAWASDAVATGGRAASTGSKLRTARAAEGDARLALRKSVEQLRLDGSHTLADLAAANPTARNLIDRLLDDARIAGVNYEADGSVEVRVALDGQRLWQMLQMTR